MENLSNEENEENSQNPGEQVEQETDYTIWKKNTPYLYDILLTWGLEWPSLCFNWLPICDKSQDSHFSVLKFLIGTQTNGGEEKNYLYVGKTRLPVNNNKRTNKDSDIKDLPFDNGAALDAFSKIKNKIEIEASVPHEGDVNKAKQMPQKDKYNFIATQTNSGEIHLFNYFLCGKNQKEFEVKPLLRLKGHTDIGYGLDWSLFREGYLLTGNFDKIVSIYDTNSQNEKPIRTYEFHEKSVSDVKFNKKCDNIFASSSDDGYIILYDLRQDNYINKVKAHDKEINSIDFNPQNEFIYLTGSNDHSIGLFDMRKPDLKLHSFDHHKDNVTNVKWNQNLGNIFASSGEDNLIMIWDILQIGANIGRDDNEEAPSEMIFEHGGHTDKINDFDWNPIQDMMCASVDGSNSLQIWEINSNCLQK